MVDTDANAGCLEQANPAGTTQNADIQTLWYFQLDDRILGPLQVSDLQKYFANDVIDGMTYCWCEGMSEWKFISDVPSIKSHLAHASDAPEGVVAYSGTLSPTATPEHHSHSEPRCLLEELPSHFKYITPEGVGQAYDVRTQQWLSFSEYRALASSTISVEPGLDQEDQRQEEAESSALSQLDSAIKKQRNVESRRKYRERLKEKKKAGLWIKGKTNPNVYVKGLPADVTEDELVQTFRRAGVIKIDPDTSRPKIRIYRLETDGQGNGDATISFVHPTSVELAIKYLNGSSFRNGCTLHVEQAQFNIADKLPGAPQDSKQRELQRKKYLAAKLEQQRLLGWNDGVSDGRMRIMLVRPLWSYKEAELHPLGDPFYSRIAANLHESLSEWTSVVSVTPIERHPRGIVCVKFRTAEDCDAGVVRLNGRPYRHLGLPDREVELVQELFLNSIHSSNSVKPPSHFEKDSTAIDFLNSQELDLLRRVDASIDAMLNPGQDADSDNVDDQDNDFSLYGSQNISVVHKRKRQRQTSQDATANVDDEHDSARLLGRALRRQRLAQFISSDALFIDAYVYDGKTDLKGQALPALGASETNVAQQPPTVAQRQTLHLTSQFETSTEVTDQQQADGHGSWEEWLKGDSSDDDDDDDDDDDGTYVIRTED